jgi:hypothetical protein
VNLWQTSLSDAERPKPKDFNRIACDVVEKENRKTSELQFKYGPSLLTCFIERGRYSNHTYQPNVNHRHVDMSNFHYPFYDTNNRIQQSLMTSLLTPDEKHDFSSGDKMSVAFYELNDTKGMSSKEIMGAGMTPILTQTAMDCGWDATLSPVLQL